MSASPVSPLALDLHATVSGLQNGLASIERHCNAHGVPREAISRILTVFEEIFTNVMKYGYGGGDGPVHITLAGADPLTLCVEDSAPHFDPTRWDSAADLTGDVDDRPIGRLGIALVMGLARRVAWEPRAPGNRLTIELAAPPAG